MWRSRCLPDWVRWVSLPIAMALAPALAAEDTELVADSAEEPDDPILKAALTPWTGDLDGILERGMLRVAIPYGLMT